MRKRGMAAVLLVCLLCVVLTGPGTVWADVERQGFSCSVGLLRQEDERYVMQVVAENAGEDFSGTIRLVFAPSTSEPCAYETELTLPRGGKKQFTLTIPENAAEISKGICTASFISEKGEELWTGTVRNVFGSGGSGIPVGILSDDYSALTYLDMGGEEFYLSRTNAPLQLIELDGETLPGYLDGLYFLIIDHYDVESLGAENIAAIEAWVLKGGWLILGTGAYAKETLGGFDEDFLRIALGDICEPGEENYVTRNWQAQGRYSDYAMQGVDLANMTVAELSISSYNGYGQYESADNPAICMQCMDGAVSVYAISLGDAELKKGNTGLYRSMLTETMYNSNSYTNSGGYDDVDYVFRQVLGLINQENTNVNFTWLKILIGIYVVLVGPFLYLIMRKSRKSEWYWVAAPLLGVLFVVGVLVFGRDIRVRDAKVYSVSVQEASSAKVETYYNAFRSGTKRWGFLLNDNYEYGGSLGEYYGYSTGNPSSFHYYVRTDSEGLSLGIVPNENFESAYLYAVGQTENRGMLTGENLRQDLTGAVSGIVRNDTEEDFSYFAVMSDSYVQVFSDVRAGESLDIDLAKRQGRCVYESAMMSFYDLFYNVTDYYSGRQSANPRDELAVLCAGLGVAQKHLPDKLGTVRLAGVAMDTGKTVKSRCDETPYRCLYSYAETEVEAHAAD